MTLAPVLYIASIASVASVSVAGTLGQATINVSFSERVKACIFVAPLPIAFIKSNISSP